jgi:basic membrane protein A and related proteins
VDVGDGPERSRSGPLRVLVPAAVGVALVAGGVVALVRAGAEGGPAPRPTSTIGRGVHVCVVVGTTGPDGGEFRVPLRRALWKAHRELATTGSLVEAHGPAPFAAAIRRFIGRGCDLTVTTGVEAPGAILTAARAYPSSHFAILGSTTGGSLPNVTAVRFHPEQAAFLAGYLAAAVSRTGIVGAFGDVSEPEVTRTLDGFAAGVEKLNADRELVIALLGWNPKRQTGLFTGSVDDTRAGRRVAQRLVADGADVVLGVDGQAVRGAAGVLDQVGDSFMIGSGWDWGQFSADPDLWLTGVQERSAVMLRLLIAREVRGEFDPGVVEATLRNGGVGLAKLRGPGGTISGRLKYNIKALALGIIRGEVPIDPSKYPPLPPPGTRPSGAATQPDDE